MFRLVIELGSRKRLSGNDLFTLLENILLYGSISRAATNAGVSYRYAWGLLQEAETVLNMNLLEKQVGGLAGGGALLTAEGKKLLLEYERFQQVTDRQLARFVARTGLPSPKPSRSGQEVRKPNRFLLLASTLEPVEAGLLDELETAFYRQKGILVRHLAAGSGRAMEIARGGRVDMVLTHAPELEREFKTQGWAFSQTPVMSSNYLLVGPVTDPAGIERAAADSTVEAFRLIASARMPFITRGDHSGTHLREVEIWEQCGITPQGNWYLLYPGVAGNLGALRFAREKNAYMLTDTASYHLSRGEDCMKVFVNTGGASELINEFVLTLVNPGKVPHSNLKEASLFARWLTREEGRQIIASFGSDTYGQQLFTPLEP